MSRVRFEIFLKGFRFLQKSVHPSFLRFFPGFAEVLLGFPKVFPRLSNGCRVFRSLWGF